MPMFRYVLVLAILSSALGCGGSAREGSGQVEYSVSAGENYDRGMKRLEDEDWSEAAKYFAFVKARFPYSKYAVLADLRLADTEFGAGAYLEAVDAYKLFIKFHPTHEMVDNGYAAYKIGECYYKMLPDDWFLVPPSWEKDQSATLDAARELADFLNKYKSSPYTPKAEEMYSKTAHLLAAHEWYVAKFYWDRDRPMGTVLRLRTLLKLYPNVGFDQDALYLLGRAYDKVGRKDDAKATYQSFLDRFPTDKRAVEVQKDLAALHP
jgi:outer membrane protein assembly factor BamD